MVPDRLADVSDWWFRLECECQMATLPVGVLIPAFGEDTSPVAIASRFRCSSCGQRPSDAALLFDEQAGAERPNPRRARRIPIPLYH